MYATFATWQDVLAFVDRGGSLSYHAPLDVNPRAVRVVKRFKNGKLRLRGAEIEFTADKAHLDRMRSRFTRIVPRDPPLKAGACVDCGKYTDYQFHDCPGK